MAQIFRCPSCKEPAFPWWKKQLLGTSKTAECPSCGADVSIDPERRFYATVGVIVLVFVVTFCAYRYGITKAAWIVVIAVPLAVLYQHYFIPLVVRPSSAGE